jgi:hypothetical protein
VKVFPFGSETSALRIAHDVADRAFLPIDFSRDHAHRRALRGLHLGDLAVLHFLVARVHHLRARGQVAPQLEPGHAALAVALGHLLVDDAAPRRHPLHVARADKALVAHAVAVLDFAVEHVRDRLHAAVRMPREALPVVVGILRPERVEQEEGIELGHLVEAEDAVQADARSFHDRLALPNFRDGADGGSVFHGGLLFLWPAV